MILVVASEKGGTGKTTIATNLAIMRLLNDKKVLLVDSDPQQSSLDFAKVRGIENIEPSITCTPVIGKESDLLIKQFSQNFDDIIIDVGGRDSATMRSVMLVADKMIIPFLPGSLDAWSTEKMSKLIEVCKESINKELVVHTVLNKADVNPKNKDNQEVINLIKTYPNILPPTSLLHYRVTYRRAIGEGKSVVEMSNNNRDSKSILEINTLYHEVYND